MKKTLALVLVLCSLLTLCIGSTAIAEDTITLRVTWWGSQTRHDNTLAAIALYEAQNPNVKIEPTFLSWDGYWETLSTQGTNIPDVFQQDYQYLKTYADNNMMYNLNEFVESGVIETEFIEENSLAGGRVDGNLYAISLGQNSQCVVWDPEMFEQAGLSAPDDMWTWDEYIQTIKTLHEKLGIYGEEYFASSYFHGLNLWLRQHGLSVYAQDGSGLGFTEADDQLVADYWQMDLDLVKIGAVPGPDIRNEIKNAENQLMITGEAAMFGALGGSNQLAAMNIASGKQFKLSALPHYTGETSGQFLKPSQFFSISATTQYPEEAAKFINFITNDIEANRDCLKGERGVPISSKVREALAPTLDDAQQEIYRYIDVVSTFAFPIGQPEPPQHAELDPILKNIQFEVLTEQITPLEGAAKLRSEAARVFAQ